MTPKHETGEKMTSVPFVASQWVQGQRVFSGYEMVPVRILCVDGPGSYPVIGIRRDGSEAWTAKGFYNVSEQPSEYWDLRILIGEEEIPPAIQGEFDDLCMTSSQATDYVRQRCLTIYAAGRAAK